MSESSTPSVHRFAWNEFAILDVTVTHVSPVDGNSGHSHVRFEVGGGNIGLGPTPERSQMTDDFTLQIVGENEHAVMADALRRVADQLEAAPRRS